MQQTGQSGGTSSGQTGSPPGTPSNPSQGYSGGHTISGGGPAQFSNLNLPGLTFPATKQQIQALLMTLPSEQRQQWSTAVPSLPDNISYDSMSSLQQACQKISQRQPA